VRRSLLWEGRKSISLLEGSQAVPARTFGRGNACDRNFFYNVGRAACVKHIVQHEI
jgi:hypothetical protein